MKNQWVIVIQYGARMIAWGPFDSYQDAHRAYRVAKSSGYVRCTMLSCDLPPQTNDNGGG